MSENVVNTDKPKVLYCHKNSLLNVYGEILVSNSLYGIYLLFNNQFPVREDIHPLFFHEILIKAAFLRRIFILQPEFCKEVVSIKYRYQ